MTSMENFFNWMLKTIPQDEVIIWFNVHNMNFEKIELYGDIFKSLNQTIIDTYMGDDSTETKISLSQEDKDAHFEWCWNKIVDGFRRENIIIKNEGGHKNYFQNFFKDTFYNQPQKNVKDAIPSFLSEVFDVEKPFTKTDLDLLTELYKLMEKNID